MARKAGAQDMATATKSKSGPKSKKQKLLLIAAIVIAIFLLLSGGILAAIGTSVSRGTTIFPNVMVSGIPVGGLTLTEAAQRLTVPMAEDQTRSVVVEFPGGNSIQVTAEEAGLSFTGYEAANLAYEFGRSGNLFSNALTYLHYRSAGIDLDPLTLFPADRALIQAVVADAAEEMGRQPADIYEIIDDQLVVINGRLIVTFNENTVVNLIIEAFSEGAHQRISYDAETSASAPIDLHAIYESVFSEPEDAIFDKELDAPTEHVMGVTFDMALAQHILDTADPGAEVRIPLIITKPEITTEYLQEVLFRDVLATSTTLLTTDEDRNTNIVLAAQEIDGLILNPGEQFDFNTVVGHANAERGFRPGGAFSGTQVITVVGGGICQVSSTLYHAILHTDLRVDARINHTLTVTYLPLGMDAAVSWDGPHFSFTNTSPFPIRLDLSREGLNFTVSIVGTQTSPYRIVPEVVYISTIAYSTIYEDDPSMPPGATRVITSGRAGHVVDVYQRFYNPDGTLARREFVARSTYQTVPQVVARGTGEAPPESPEEPPPSPPPDDDPT